MNGPTTETTLAAVSEELSGLGQAVVLNADVLTVPAMSESGYTVSIVRDLVVEFGELWHYHAPDVSECLFTFFRGLYPGTRLTHYLTGRHLYFSKVHVRDASGGWVPYGSVGAFRLPLFHRAKVHLINSHLTRDQAEAACAHVHRKLGLPWPEDANPNAGA